MKRIKAAGFEMEVDDAWVERWDPDIARQSHMTEDECFAALRVTFTLTKDEAIKMLGKGNLPTLSGEGIPSVSNDDLPHNGERWALVRVLP
jgi:hypothetical protein